MSVAPHAFVMRLSEIITIYLAAAAPFGVAYFLRRQTLRPYRPRMIVRATGVALLWPLAATRILLQRRSAIALSPAEGDADAQTPRAEEKIEAAKRALVNSLRAVEDLLAHTPGFKSESTRHTMFAARECVERYTGLTLAASDTSADAAPSAHEMELCRLAGRTGDDLLLAGRCTHRLNVSRLLAHRERARTELLHAFAAVSETAHTLCSASPWPGSPPHDAVETLLHTFTRAIELHSLLDDAGAALKVSLLLDAERARLRQQDVHQPTDAPNITSAPRGGELCTTPAAHKAFASPLTRTMTSERG